MKRKINHDQLNHGGFPQRPPKQSPNLLCNYLDHDLRNLKASHRLGSSLFLDHGVVLEPMVTTIMNSETTVDCSGWASASSTTKRMLETRNPRKNSGDFLHIFWPSINCWFGFRNHPRARWFLLISRSYFYIFLPYRDFHKWGYP